MDIISKVYDELEDLSPSFSRNSFYLFLRYFHATKKMCDQFQNANLH